MKNVALITGSYGGLGKCFAEIHANLGNDLVLVGKSQDKLDEQVQELKLKYPIQIQTIAVDLTHKNAAQTIYDTCKQNNWEIEYIINNAGFGGQGNFVLDRSLDQDMNMIAVNLETPTKICKLFLADMIQRKSGKILNISSVASLLPGPLQSVYFATKSYITSFSNSLWRELKGTGVSVTVLLPSAMHTGFEKTGNLTKTKLFKHAVQPMKVAQKGYNAMMKSKIQVQAGAPFLWRIGLSMINMLPKKCVLDYVYNLQKNR